MGQPGARLGACPEDNVSLEPEGVDIHPVSPAAPNLSPGRDFFFPPTSERNKKDVILKV